MTDVQTWLQAELVSIMHQLGMTDFVIDLDRYIKELASTQKLIKEAAATSKNSTLSILSSPLTKEEETALECTEIWWTSSSHNTSLARDHPRYHKTCFQCRKLGHICINCSLYRCPTCFRTSPGYIQARCPLKRHTFQTSIFFLVFWWRTLLSSSTFLSYGYHQTSSCLPHLISSLKPFLISNLRRWWSNQQSMGQPWWWTHIQCIRVLRYPHRCLRLSRGVMLQFTPIHPYLLFSQTYLFFSSQLLILLMSLACWLTYLCNCFLPSFCLLRLLWLILTYSYLLLHNSITFHWFPFALSLFQNFPSLRYINPRLTLCIPKLDLLCTLVHCYTNLVPFFLLSSLTLCKPSPVLWTGDLSSEPLIYA